MLFRSDLALVDDDGADRDFAGGFRGAGFGDGGAEEGEVVGRRHPECMIVHKRTCRYVFIVKSVKRWWNGEHSDAMEPGDLDPYGH